MISPTAKEIFIQGITRDGRTFRPSDWAERLAGVMSSFRPGGAFPGSYLSYSPWCVPTSINGVKCVIVNRDLRDAEPMAWDFCVNFAKDNDLQVSEVSPAPPAPAMPKAAQTPVAATVRSDPVAPVIPVEPPKP
ncbi:DUF3579 domain-containing protein [Variovorax sp. J22G73]|uniref:DUF3579 domain-containing protein n=1 Tax=unclassified Variovorax TaxID=663243 RepID=UPI000D5FD648|nr:MULTISPECIES: DUF3579 domain-containing protein [unclassified Variovorax]MDM0004092.1 DUF3579 domain-containing protein [Variovorax sp. J22R203]MDM0096242.1 DUF3579 domain-containing protein [Variovorax sp. J22G73]